MSTLTPITELQKLEYSERAKSDAAFSYRYPVPAAISASKVFRGHDNSVDGVCWLTNTRFVSGSHDHTLRVWDISKPDPIQTLKHHKNGIYNVCVSPNQKYVVSCSSGTENNMVLWDVLPDGTLGTPRELLGHPDTVYCAAFCPRSQVVISGGKDGFVRLYDATQTDGKPTASVKLHEDIVTSAAFCHDSAVPNGTTLALVTSRDGGMSALTIMADKTSYVRINHAHEGKPVHAGAFVDQHTVLSCGGDFLIRKFDLRLLQTEGNTHCSSVLSYTGHTDVVKNITVSPDGIKFASCCADGSVRLWLVDEMGALRARRDGIQQQVEKLENESKIQVGLHDSGADFDMTVIKKNTKAAAELRGAIRHLDQEIRLLEGRGEQEAVSSLGGHKTQVAACAWQDIGNGKALLLTGSWDQTVRLWEVPQFGVRL
eukprot:GDKI01019212.1.p1 GENE.GDKI01019212.1~~GDKI01019212.1.p1  ORF type:complete len:428 (-),score=101.19 GDKI01019212.1:356-1639(-)